MKNGADWAKIEGEYINSNDSLKTLAERYEVPLSAVKHRSAKGKWSEKRRKCAEKKARKISDRLSERDVSRTVKDIERCCKAAGKLIDKVNAAIAQLDKTIYIALDDMTKETEESHPEGVERIRTVKKRKLKTATAKSTVDTKRLSELAKALVNIKTVLSGDDGQADRTDSSGVIEIAAATQLDPPPTDGADSG